MTSGAKSDSNRGPSYLSRFSYHVGEGDDGLVWLRPVLDGIVTMFGNDLEVRCLQKRERRSLYTMLM